jgi:outer membrane protein OmpA-like peptidoglycan-associated protein
MKQLAVVFMLLIGATLQAQEQFSVYFDSNKHELQKSELQKLNDWITQNSEVKIVAINGYTDEDGTIGFNDTLAKKRVAHIVNQINNKIKIRDDFKTRSFGELHQQEVNKAKNRKVTLYFILPKDLHREDEILGIKKQATAPAPKPKRNYPDIIEIQNPNGTTSQFELDVNFMKQVDEAKPGDKLKIENLNFQLNTFAIVNESRGKLYELLIVMQQNPTLKIAIHGHLCCMPVDRNKLSNQRAKAVHNFLVFNGIDKSRLSYEGFGSSQPIHSLPEKSEAERAANRRVEVYVIEN